MLAVAPLRSIKDEKNQGEMEGFSMATATTPDDVDFVDLSEGNLLESINFDDLFVGIDVDGDVLPDLEMFGEFSVSAGEESSEMNSSADNSKEENDKNCVITASKTEEEDKSSCAASPQDSGSNPGEEIVSNKNGESVVVNPAPKEGGKGKKSSSAQLKNNSNSNNPQGKRKLKVARLFVLITYLVISCFYFSFSST